MCRKSKGEGDIELASAVCGGVVVVIRLLLLLCYHRHPVFFLAGKVFLAGKLHGQSVAGWLVV